MPDQQETLNEARRLIQLQKYEQARGVLWTIRDHPTAKQWLVKLDEIDSPFVNNTRNQPNTSHLNQITNVFVKHGWKISSQTQYGVALETKKAPKYWKEVLLFELACLVLIVTTHSLEGLFAGAIAGGVALEFLSPRSKRVNAHIELLDDDSVQVTSNRRYLNAIYPAGYSGRIRT